MYHLGKKLNMKIYIQLILTKVIMIMKKEVVKY